MTESFMWPVATAGYRWEGGKDPVLVPVQKWPQRQYAPLEDNPALFLEFAGLEPGREAIVDFADRYGELGSVSVGDLFRGGERLSFIPYGVHRAPPPPAGEQHTTPAGEKYTTWTNQSALMRRAVDLWELLKRGETTGEEVEELQRVVSEQLQHTTAPLLTADTRRGGMALQFRPLSLRGALWLQLAEAVAQNKKYRQCESCKCWFELSPERARADSLYCKGGCRSRAYRLRQELARQLHDQGKTPRQIGLELGSDAATVKKWLAAWRK
jgi:hypothetical protein